MQSTLALRPIEAAHATVLSAAFAAIGWSKPASIFEQYFDEQSQGGRWVRIAHRGAEIAGYITLVWDSNDPVLREAGIPEIVDLNVLPQFRRQGIGSALLDGWPALEHAIVALDDDLTIRMIKVMAAQKAHCGVRPSNRTRPSKPVASR